MKVLVTGGAGFIGRWVVKRLLQDHHQVWVIDNLTNGKLDNLRQFESEPGLQDVAVGDVQDGFLLQKLFENQFDLCFHLAASINVQDSIDDPKATFDNDVAGTFQVLEQCRYTQTKLVFVSTCMVYAAASHPEGIRETDSSKPLSPYAGAKLAAEHLVLSYYHAYGLPVVVVRPFNTYGPFQKSGGEGGVVSIFIKNKLSQEPLRIYGNGTQTRDFLYAEDCAGFVVDAGYSNTVNGEIVNAGSGADISIKDLASLVGGDKSVIQLVPHIHPQSEIARLQCNYSKAKQLLGWEPKVNLREGIVRTEAWIRQEGSP